MYWGWEEGGCRLGAVRFGGARMDGLSENNYRGEGKKGGRPNGKAL